MDDTTLFDMETKETAWCPGCGNFGILAALKKALAESGRKPGDTVIVDHGQVLVNTHLARRVPETP